MSAAPRLFGTDGIRGPAGEPPLDSSSLERLGVALGRILRAKTSAAQALLAGDTRASTPMICASLAAGLERSGCSVRYGGVLPTPAVARLTPETGSAVGIAVSASHNPYADNGVKLLDPHGFKWNRDAEKRLELEFERTRPPEESVEIESEPDSSLREIYFQRLLEYFPGHSLEGLTIVLDTANGAATDLAPRFFEELGATVFCLGDRPNGVNINHEVGSTSPRAAADAVTEHGADFGFAFDGDADRVVLVDETGAVRDGDAMLFLLAKTLLDEGQLEPPRIVVTTMSNLGLEVALRAAGIEIVRCDVGDRVVVETLRQEALLLGGEQSGHIVNLDLSSTGDGLLTAAMVARAVVRAGRPVSECLEEFQRFPQVLHNIRVTRKPDFSTLPSVTQEAEKVANELGNDGRLVLRYSGTEPLARVMIEGRDQEKIEHLAYALGSVIQEEIGAEEPR